MNLEPLNIEQLRTALAKEVEESGVKHELIGELEAEIRELITYAAIVGSPTDTVHREVLQHAKETLARAHRLRCAGYRK